MSRWLLLCLKIGSERRDQRRRRKRRSESNTLQWNLLDWRAEENLRWPRVVIASHHWTDIISYWSEKFTNSLHVTVWFLNERSGTSLARQDLSSCHAHHIRRTHHSVIHFQARACSFTKSAKNKFIGCKAIFNNDSISIATVRTFDDFFC